MKYKRVPQKFVIEIVKEVTKVVNYLPKENGVHMIQSPCHIVTGIPFRIPHTSMGQFMHGNIGRSNNTEEERTVDSIYID